MNTRRQELSKAEIFSGICGFTTDVEVSMSGSNCTLSIESACKSIQRLAAEMRQVDPLREITFRDEPPLTLQLGAKHCPHTACPVPVGILKAVEVEAGLALPADVTIKVSKSE